ncbi:MAG: hypothetical protein BWY89_01613 [Bacteroidetes bacterium ADurb.BinA012]|nr:MAG: hypothetical protein BWY89_01613 [Bacteroidetes bacterium ADurb.BinA012]
MSGQRPVYALQLVIMVEAVADACVNSVFLPREVLVEKVGVVALLGCIVLVVSQPGVHLMEGEALDPAQRHIVIRAEHAAQLGEGFSPLCGHVYPVAAVPGVWRVAVIVKLAADSLLIHVLDACAEGEIIAEVVPPVHETVLPDVGLIAEAVFVMVAGA